MKNKKYLNDLILIAVLVVAAIASFVIYNSGSSSGDKVVVRLSDEIIGTYNLNIDGEYVLNNGSNTIVIEDGRVYMKDADCPDKLCVHQGKIRNSNQCITCLPNKITITISSDNSEVDLVS